MSDKFKDKKILFLGSTLNIVGMVKKAQQMGLYTIVTDYNPYDKAPAKHVADEYADISLADVDAIVDLIIKKNIDGVLTGFSDSYLQYYLEICQKSGVPCYGDATSFGIATDKVLFKRACQAFDINTIPGDGVKEYEEAVILASKLGYPVMVKPSDNSGSRGVVRCDCVEDLREAFDYALSFSPSKTVICEKYMTCDVFTASYQLIDSKAYLSLTGDRYNYISDKDGSSIGGVSTYYSQYTDRYIKEIDDKVKNMLSHKGFSNGMVSFQSFVDEKSFYMCEMCFRPSGGQHYILIEDQKGINSLELLIEYAVNGVVEWTHETISPYFDDLCAMIRIIGKPDEEIALYEGLEEVKSMDGVVEIKQLLDAGDKIGKDGTTAQVVASVWCKANNINTISEIYNQVINTLNIQNRHGELLIIPVPYFRENIRDNKL